MDAGALTEEAHTGGDDGGDNGGDGDGDGGGGGGGDLDTKGEATAKLTTKETKKDGGFATSLLVRYARAIGGGWLSLYFSSLLATYAALLFADVQLSLFVETAATSRDAATQHLLVYLATALGHVALIVVASVSFAFGCVRASRSLHRNVVAKLLHAPLSWYDSTPSGRTMSRFTTDVSQVDLQLSLELDNTFQMSSSLLMLCGLVAVVARPLMTALVPVTLVTWGVLLLVIDRNNREVKRLSNNAVSPVLSSVYEIKLGAPIVRAMGFAPFFARRAAAAIERWASLVYYQRALQTWGQHVSSHLSFLLCGTCSVYLVATREERSAELGALTLTYVLMLPYFAGLLAMLFPTMRTYLACLERLLEYLELPQEAPRSLASDPPPAEWPTDGGRIVFNDVRLRYRPNLPLALCGFSAVVAPRTKAGIVGRTGAGKSSLILALFRLVELEGGTIEIDGRSCAGLGLAALRRAISIIPQDPVLHKGSVAHNLDPFGKRTPAELGAALRRAGLPEAMQAAEVAKGGSNLSSGERQLLCFARALLQATPILILDEATSNLDDATDAEVQRLLRDEFGGRTIITVAHRLQTVVDYDAILVMAAGRLVEHGAPHDLLGRKESALSALADALGDDAALSLRAQASKAAEAKAVGTAEVEVDASRAAPDAAKTRVDAEVA